MVGERLYEVPKSTYIRFWHHSALELFKYLYYQRLLGAAWTVCALAL